MVTICIYGRNQILFLRVMQKKKKKSPGVKGISSKVRSPERIQKSQFQQHLIN